MGKVERVNVDNDGTATRDGEVYVEEPGARGEAVEGGGPRTCRGYLT